ncbi:hypothetical protein OBBRIDRAFT_792216 [Obba rivulosa]|uniref:BTB domain-containing protein n=1 Tax=Obba rivulosa TaxID=1052685 RepID=A0A8E2AV26_9APHY|nr:hypothetical protein OBBRIDRAFT_792216 [Obba rivulosa]
MHNFLSEPDPIICSCDDTDFLVHKAILRSASHVFAAMLDPDSPVAANAADNNGKAVSLEENTCTLDALFRICYLITDPMPKDAGEILVVLEATKKYIIDLTVEFCRKLLVSPQILHRDPLSVFAITYHYGMMDGAASLRNAACMSTCPRDSRLQVLTSSTVQLSGRSSATRKPAKTRSEG